MARVREATNAAPATKILRPTIISASGSTGPEDWTVSITVPRRHGSNEKGTIKYHCVLRTVVTANESDLAWAPCGDLTRGGGIPGNGSMRGGMIDRQGIRQRWESVGSKLDATDAAPTKREDQNKRRQKRRLDAWAGSETGASCVS
jgi:hypothetical protein